MSNKHQKKLVFRCNLCGADSDFQEKSLHRELPSCQACGSTVRHRQVIQAYHVVRSMVGVLGGRRRKVVGLSDHYLISDFFAGLKEIHYINTFVDENPKLDITKPDKELLKSASILISSDVLEHVTFPLGKALCGKFEVLQPGGWLILTCPYVVRGPAVEHYPWLTDYRVDVLKEGVFKVVALDANNQEFEIEHPIFHGGPGRTLEMRALALDVILQELDEAGFRNIRVLADDYKSLGIIPTEGQGVIVAQRPQRFGKIKTVKSRNLDDRL